MPVVLGVVEPAAVEVVAEVAGACSVAVGVVGAVIAVGVDGVVLNEQKKNKTAGQEDTQLFTTINIH